MNNEIDNKILASIEEQAGYNLTVFRARFNDGTMDAIMVFRDIHNVYGRYMTNDYCTTVLKLLRFRVERALKPECV